MKKTLICLRGLPGSGKTTLAHFFVSMFDLTNPDACRCTSADDFMEDEDGNYDFDPNRLGYCHKKCQEVTEYCLSIDTPIVIVHNTNTTDKELKTYQKLADDHGYRFVSLIVENRHGNDSVHDVPNHAMERMANRFSVKLK